MDFLMEKHLGCLLDALKETKMEILLEKYWDLPMVYSMAMRREMRTDYCLAEPLENSRVEMTAFLLDLYLVSCLDEARL